MDTAGPSASDLNGASQVTRVLGLVGAYAARGASVGALAVLVDGLLHSQAGVLWLVPGLGLGGAAGALSAGILSLLLVLLGFMPWAPLRWALVSLAGAMGAFVITHELGVVERLSGPYASLAWLALAGAIALMVGTAALLVGFSPNLRSPECSQATLFAAPLGKRPRLQRAVGIVLLVSGAVCALADALVLVGHYPFAHELLRRVTLLAGALALLALPVPTRLTRGLAFLSVPLFALALLTLHGGRAHVVSALRVAPFLELSIDDLRSLGDSDLDGFSGLLAGGDCAPFDATVHPEAREVPANGKDDNCRLGDLPRPPARTVPTLRAVQAPASIVLITIDTLRADHLSSYGYARNTSPNIDAFFASGTRFLDAIAAGAYTTISLPALMRGYYPRHLDWGVGRQTDKFRLLPADGALAPGEGWFRAHLLAFDARHAPLAVLLSQLGYRTWAVVDDGGWAFLSRPLVGQGFARFVYVPAESGGLWDPEGDARVARMALEVLAQRDDRPFFLWLHFIGVHAPDAKHAGVPEFGSDVVAAYDHEIAHVDRELAPVFAKLSEVERERPLVTLLTADHGEAFLPQGRAHGSSLSEDELRVPMLLRGQGVARGVVSEVVSLVDVVPTLLVRAGVSDGSGFDGVDALSPARLAHRKAVLSDVWRYDAVGQLEFDRVSALAGDHRLVFEAARNSVRLYRRGAGDELLFDDDAELSRAAARYLESTGPRPLQLLE